MEPTLNVPMLKFKQIVGRHLGFGRGDQAGGRAWDDRQKADIDDVLDSALRQFYDPPPLGPGQAPHKWSFLRPRATLTLASGESELDLPQDFGGVEGQLSVSADEGGTWRPVDVANEPSVRQMLARFPDATGWPLTAAVAPQRITVAGASPRAKLVVYPQADQDYTVGLQYYLIPEALTAAFPYAYGGAQHAETLIESCLAIAEQRVDDAAGLHTEKFMERLAASVGADRQKKAQRLGANLDRSDDLYYGYGPRRHGDRVTTTFDGTEWD